MVSQHPSVVFDWVGEAQERLQESRQMRLAHTKGLAYSPKEYAEMARKLASSINKLISISEKQGNWEDHVQLLEEEVELLVLDAGWHADRTRTYRFHWKDGTYNDEKGETQADAYSKLFLTEGFELKADLGRVELLLKSES